MKRRIAPRDHTGSAPRNSGRAWRFPTVLAVMLALPVPVRAAPAPAADACGPQPGDAPAAVASVSETLELRLADGRLLRLAGLDPPRATSDDPALPGKARSALEAWLAVGAVTMRSLAPEPDRWNRTPVFLFHPAPFASPAASAAEALLQGGWARARPEQAVHDCFAAYLAQEGAARAARRGLWGDPHYAVLDPDDAAAVAQQAGGLAIAEGPLRVHDSHGTLYLTLGRDPWGLTAVLPRRAAARFAKAGLDVTDYVGTVVRLRGDLDDRFGPRLALDDPDGFESVEPGTGRDAEAHADTVSAKHWTSRAPGR